MLQTNPFYILNIPMGASKGQAAAAAEALALGDSRFDGEALLGALVNPEARLAAEIGWFPEASEAAAAEIRSTVRASRPVTCGGLRGLSLLNAVLYNFGIRVVAGDSRDPAGALADQIWQISEIYNSINAEELTERINSLRQEAGVTPADRGSVETALAERRYDISDEIDRLLRNSVSDGLYTQVVSELAKSMLSRKDMKIRMVINDVIDRYETAYSSEILEVEDRITDITSRIINAKGFEATSASMTISKGQLTSALEKWVELTRPMLIRADRLGLEYQGMTGVGDKVYAAVVDIGDEKTFDNHFIFAVNMSKELRWIFADNRKLYEPYERIVNTQKERTRKARESFLRGSVFRFWTGFLAFCCFAYIFIGITVATSPEVPAEDRTDSLVITGIAAAGLIFFVYQFIKSVRRKREYEQSEDSEDA